MKSPEQEIIGAYPAEFHAEPRDESGRAYVRSCIRQYGENSLCGLALEDDKSWFFPGNVEGFASYALSGRTMVICGDPVCKRDQIPEFLADLKTFSGERHLHVVFLFVLEKNLPYYHDAGYGCYKAGEEASFDVRSWSMEGGRMAKVRSSWHTAQHRGLSVHEYCPQRKRNPDVEGQMRDITDQWLGDKHTARLQFAVGSLMLENPEDKRYFYASDPDGMIQGFNVLNPYLGGKGWIIDIMRRREGAPHGVMELLFHDIMQTLKEENVQYLSLGIAPFFNTNDGPDPSLFEKAEHYIYGHMNYIYGFKPLQEAKEKYSPVWSNVYLACHPKHMSPWMDLAACSILDSQGFGDYVRAFLDMKKAGKEQKSK
jgi:phosphatidylglycerol lysyltransferase